MIHELKYVLSNLYLFSSKKSQQKLLLKETAKKFHIQFQLASRSSRRVAMIQQFRKHKQVISFHLLFIVFICARLVILSFSKWTINLVYSHCFRIRRASLRMHKVSFEKFVSFRCLPTIVEIINLFWGVSMVLPFCFETSQHRQQFGSSTTSCLSLFFSFIEFQNGNVS